MKYDWLGRTLNPHPCLNALFGHGHFVDWHGIPWRLNSFCCSLVLRLNVQNPVINADTLHSYICEDMDNIDSIL